MATAQKPAATKQAEPKVVAPKTSRVGKKPVPTPKGVTVSIANALVKIKGPKGELSFGLHASITVAQEDGKLAISSSAPGRDAARLSGMTRSIIANMVQGVTAGYARTLELHGTGYRVELKGTSLNCVLGFS